MELVRQRMVRYIDLRSVSVSLLALLLLTFASHAQSLADQDSGAVGIPEDLWYYRWGDSPAVYSPWCKVVPRYVGISAIPHWLVCFLRANLLRPNSLWIYLRRTTGSKLSIQHDGRSGAGC